MKVLDQVKYSEVQDDQSVITYAGTIIKIKVSGSVTTYFVSEFGSDKIRELTADDISAI